MRLGLGLPFKHLAVIGMPWPLVHLFFIASYLHSSSSKEDEEVESEEMWSDLIAPLVKIDSVPQLKVDCDIGCCCICCTL